MSNIADKTWRTLAWLHRWVGVALCLLFAMWFASGAIMVFVPWPSLPQAARFAARTPIDMAQLHKTPVDVLGDDATTSGLKLIGIEGRPVYVVSHPGELDRAIAGDTGDDVPSLNAEAARRIAEGFLSTKAQDVSGPFAYDQWIVPNGYDPLRPFFKVSFADPAGTKLYVSQRTGEVMQRTTRSARTWNTFGAVLHWIYFTPIRQSWERWDLLVWWVSLVGTGLTIVGIVLGLYRLAVARALDRGLSPFRAWLKWHHVIGLFAGVFVLTWILSGWLSMDHGRLFSTGEATATEIQAMAGKPLYAAMAPVDLDFLHSLDAPVEVRFSAVSAEPVATAIDKSGEPSVYVMGDGGFSPRSGLPEALLAGGVARAWPDANMQFAGIAADDDFYAMAEEMGGALRLFTSQTGPALSIYVDGQSGRIVKVMDDSRRAYAWIYYALHTMRVPGLLANEPLRQVIVLALLALGFAFSVSGVVLGIKRMRRSFSSV